MLRASIVLLDQQPYLTHELATLAAQAGIDLSPELLALQPFAVKARYSAEDTPLPGDRLFLWREIDKPASALVERLAH